MANLRLNQVLQNIICHKHKTWHKIVLLSNNLFPFKKGPKPNKSKDLGPIASRHLLNISSIH